MPDVASGEPVLIGDLHRLLTLLKKVCPGIPPSRAKAYIIRELEVTENVLCVTMALIKQLSHGC